MKKLLLPLLTLTCVILSGCTNIGSKGTKVSRDEFVEAVNKIQTHQHKKMTYTYTTKSYGTGSQKEYKGESKVVYIYKYNEKSKEWIHESSGRTVSTYVLSSKKTKYFDEDSRISYYINPFKIMYEDGSLYTEDPYYAMRLQGVPLEVRYDKYGYQTYLGYTQKYLYDDGTSTYEFKEIWEYK